MPAFSKSSAARLATCHPDLELIFNTVVETYDCTIFCGYRNKVEQQQAYQTGKSQLQFPRSKHNQVPSMAVDAGPYFKSLHNTDWRDDRAFSHFAGYVLRVAQELFDKGMVSHSIRWGGDWDSDGQTRDQSFHDLPHFELM